MKKLIFDAMVVVMNADSGRNFRIEVCDNYKFN